MLRDRLFVFRPGFIDPELSAVERFFCPFSAQVMGYLGYYPEVARTLEVHELDFARPRLALVELLGAAHQAAPLLVLGDGAPAEAPRGVTVSEANGRRFVARTIEILRYLSATRGLPGPH